MENEGNADERNKKQYQAGYTNGYRRGTALGFILGGLIGWSSMSIFEKELSKFDRYLSFVNQNWQVEQGYASPSDISIHVRDNNCDGKDELYLECKNLQYGVLYDPNTQRCSIRPFRIITNNDRAQRPQIVYEDGGK